MKMGYTPIEAMKENPNLLGASTLVALQDYSSFQKDFHKNLTDIVKYKLAIQERTKELSDAASAANTEDEKKTQAESIKNDAKIQEYTKKLKELRDVFEKEMKNKIKNPFIYTRNLNELNNRIEESETIGQIVRKKNNQYIQEDWNGFIIQGKIENS